MWYRCDRLKECLEMERDKYQQLEHSTQLELQELMNQVELGEEAVLESNRYQRTKYFFPILIAILEVDTQLLHI